MRINVLQGKEGVAALQHAGEKITEIGKWHLSASATENAGICLFQLPKTAFGFT